MSTAAMPASGTASRSPRRPVGRRTAAGWSGFRRRLASPGVTNGGCEVGYWQSGVYVEHVPTGLFLYGAYGQDFLIERRFGLQRQWPRSLDGQRRYPSALEPARSHGALRHRLTNARTWSIFNAGDVATKPKTTSSTTRARRVEPRCCPGNRRCRHVGVDAVSTT